MSEVTSLPAHHAEYRRQIAYHRGQYIESFWYENRGTPYAVLSLNFGRGTLDTGGWSTQIKLTVPEMEVAFAELDYRNGGRGHGLPRLYWDYGGVGVGEEGYVPGLGIRGPDLFSASAPHAAGKEAQQHLRERLAEVGIVKD